MLPDEETLRAARNAFDRLHELIFTEVGGHADPQASKELADLIGVACRAITDPYILGKADHAKDWLPILFSARRHIDWANDGGESVRHFLRQDVRMLGVGLQEVETKIRNGKLN